MLDFAHLLSPQLPVNEDELDDFSELQIMQIRCNDFIKDEFNVVKEEWHIRVTYMC